MTNINYAFITTSFRATHSWPTCNISEVSFLKNEHHHEFKVKVWIQQFHNDRDIEYLLFQKYLDKLIIRMLKELKQSRSCEDMMTFILKILKKKYDNRLIKVEVNEDGYYGAYSEPEYKNFYDKDISWLAGIVDGEGSIYLTKANFRPCVMIGNYNYKIIKKAYDVIKSYKIVQNKIFIEKSTPKRILKKPFYRVAITGLDNVSKFLHCIKPHLIGKNRQAIILANYCDYRIMKGKYSDYDSKSLHAVKQLQKINDSNEKEY